jgi:hypothetical protein
MDEHQRKRVELILAHELELARRATNQAANAIYAGHSAKGSLGSGATNKAVLKAIEANANGLLDKLIEVIGKFARNREAFALIDAAITDHFDDVKGEVQRAARMVSGRRAQEATPSAAKMTDDMFGQIKTDMWQRLEIEKFEFELDELVAAPVESLPVSLPKNKGGKPLAPHWDQMWSSIAVRLWLGDLKPKRQADVKEAMLAWFAENEIGIGDTAVTERARQLWQKMEATL